MLQFVAETINFSKEEENILQFWKEKHIFEESLKKSKGKKKYSFYDGPPFATGLPHYGHVLAGTIKDIVTRYAHQSGFHVERRFGWDCHGLPVEFEVDKALNIKGPDDVAKMGIAAYNESCRKIVTRYVHEWETIVTRIGRWIDFENDYKTLYPWYMESIWWVFSELWNKGLIYKGVKVMPYSTACNTPLSNFESGQNYKEVVDPAIFVTFPLVDEPNTSLIAWTTTPWTLPSNMALCVNPNLEYVKVKIKQKDKQANEDSKMSDKVEQSSDLYYILLHARLDFVFKSSSDYEIVEKFNGAVLKGKRYEPIFDYYKHITTAFVILNDSFVVEESGTGVVHSAPYFGEDDYRVCLNGEVITHDQEIVCPINASGNFTLPVKEFLGQYCKDADKNIIKHLKAAGRLFNASTIKHSYPFCWRSDTPLIYKAVSSWFIRVQSMRDDLIACTKETYWVPDFVKQKRFGNWLRDARDWAISRNRYWGTPIPLWSSEDGEEIVCVNSIAELEKLSGVHINDLHRETVDNIVIPSVYENKPPLRRVPEVFDCWFESGSMPYAQLHYPFENKKEFEEKFPADFIAEGIDQTRGWFYTLLVVSTALFNKPPFKNLIANGLILASDGQKMSKRKKNYPDPMEIVGKYGADALRLYLINSPVVRAENLRFKEEGVRDILKEVFLPWYNAYRFLVQNILQFTKEKEISYKFDSSLRSTNVMDKWILSFAQSLLKFVHQEMAAYHLYTVVPQLIKFIDNLTNWYVRMNRRRFRGESGVDDCQQALTTLTDVLFVMIRIMSPFTPFFSEFIYQNFRFLFSEYEQSIHYLMLPSPRSEIIDESIERAVSRMQIVIELGRIVRDRKTLPLKFPLKEIVIIHNDADFLEDIENMSHYIKEELNVRKVTTSADKEKYGVSLKAEPDHKVLGSKLKSAFKDVMAIIKQLTKDQIQEFLKSGSLTVENYTFETGDLRIISSFTGLAAKELSQKYEAHSEKNALILLDVTPDQALQEEGTAREIINRVQKLRKKAHVIPTDRITVHYTITPADSDLSRIANEHAAFISTAIKVPFINSQPLTPTILGENQELRNANLYLMLAREEEEDNGTAVEPNCRYVNVILNGVKPRCGAKSVSGTILLENPAGENFLSYDQLLLEVTRLFGMYGQRLILKDSSNIVLDEKHMNNLHKKTVFIEPYYCRKYISTKFTPHSDLIFSRFINIIYENKRACILTENPKGREFIENNVDRLVHMASVIFNRQFRNTDIKVVDKHTRQLTVS